MSHLSEEVQALLSVDNIARIDLIKAEEDEKEAAAEMKAEGFVVDDEGMTLEEMHAIDMWMVNQQGTANVLQSGANGRVAEARRKQNDYLQQAYEAAAEYLVLDMADPLFEDIYPQIGALKQGYAKEQRKIDKAHEIEDAIAEQRRQQAQAERDRLAAEAEAAEAAIVAKVQDENLRRKVAMDVILADAKFPNSKSNLLESLLFTLESPNAPKTKEQKRFAELLKKLERSSTVVLEETARDIISRGGAGPADGPAGGAGPAAFSANTVRGRRGSRAAKRFR